MKKKPLPAKQKRSRKYPQKREQKTTLKIKKTEEHRAQ